MKKSFEMELVINGCTKVFDEGFEPGGFSKQVVTFDVDEHKADSPMLMAAVHEAGQKFLASEVTVKIREVQEKESEKNNEAN